MARELTVQNPCRYREVAAAKLRPWVLQLLAELDPEERGLTLRFVSDREMLRLNHQFRGKAKSTDVLSFPGDEPGDDPGDSHLGDVVISVPTARRQAEARGYAVERELKLLALHGVLHCLGYDHERDQGEMKVLEAKLRRRFLSHGQ